MTLRWVPGWNGLTEPEAVSYVAAVEAADGEPLEFGVAKAINDFVLGCKNDGIWDAIRASCILAGARTLAGALVPLVGDAPTNVGGNFVAGDYNRETGLNGDGSTKYLDSNRNNNADPQNNRHISLYVSSAHNPVTAASYIGAGRNNTGASNMGATGVAQNSFFARSSCAAPEFAILSRLHTGFAGISRNSAPEYVFLLPPGVNRTVVQASQTPFNGNFFVFGENNSGTLSEPTDARLAFYSIGEFLDLAALDTRVSALITAIGAAIP
jgi:hypothetical protein